jgi:PhzF family phenazine biosynthesis protein
MSQTLPLYHVDAFSREVFAGNPAAVVPLREWPDDALMQRIAAENNLSETAFLVGQGERYRIRWFTPVREVDLCGHATLASAYVITRFLAPDAGTLRFDSLSGELVVRRTGDTLELDFPARPAQAADAGLAGDLSRALGASTRWCGSTRNPDPDSDKLVAWLEDAGAVRSLKPDFAAMRQLPGQGVIVTAAGEDCDFVSRYFVPKLGIPEDPVTGSAHCTLVPFWAEKLGREELHARQLSARGGELACRLVGERVRIAGHCALYLEGRLAV